MNLTINTRKISKTKLNFWQDAVTLLIFIAVAVTAFTNVQLHKWIGLGLSIIVFIHLALHWQWLVSMSKRFTKKMSVKLRLKLLLDWVLLLLFLLLTFSGIIVALIYAPNVTAFHNVCFYLFTGLSAAHLALNWKWILHNGTRLLIAPVVRFVIALSQRDTLPKPQLEQTGASQ